jgi:pentatricopeptide repeat protein
MLLEQDRPAGYVSLEAAVPAYKVKPFSRRQTLDYLSELRHHKALLTGKPSESLTLAPSTSSLLSGNDDKSLSYTNVPPDVNIEAVECLASLLHPDHVTPSSLAERLTNAKEVIALCNDVKMPFTSNSFSKIIEYVSNGESSASAQATVELFEMMMANALVPDVTCWTSLVKAKCTLEGPAAGQKVIDNLKSIGVPTPMNMFNHVLEAHIVKRQYDIADQYFSEMHLEGRLNAESFEIMFRRCAYTYAGERADLYMQEMKALGIPRTEDAYCSYIRAIAECPHWVKGYENSIYEAMLRVEADQFVPTVKFYNSVIHAFARARDPKAAEYYFWEMREKGLKPDIGTYESLLWAFAREQSVGAARYGTKVNLSAP